VKRQKRRGRKEGRREKEKVEDGRMYTVNKKASVK
jgi:hypothetical protein